MRIETFVTHKRCIITLFQNVCFLYYVCMIGDEDKVYAAVYVKWKENFINDISQESST